LIARIQKLSDVAPLSGISFDINMLRPHMQKKEIFFNHPEIVHNLNGMPKRNLPNKKSIRLKGWDYRNPELYFITICTKNREHHFGEIKDGIMGLSVPGCIAWHYWRQISDHQSRVVLDQFVVMPNHIHGIIGIKSIKTSEKESVGTLHATSIQNEDQAKKNISSISPDAGSLSVIIRSYKSAVTQMVQCQRPRIFCMAVEVLRSYHPK
jgi:hypothetical protein